MNMETIGQWSFIIGVAVAVLAGVFGAYNESARLVLVLLGILVGFLNISDKETTDFLVAAAALLLTGILTGTAGLNTLPYIGYYIGAILPNISTFVAPAAIIVALKAIYAMGKEK
ncbi:MAG: hypothetical protein JW727_04045 [Candidatus Aenigmarchaeota archaeon]|nr:hypothetical protein [Candidatus Aenigmarchaeota archaeon]